MLQTSIIILLVKYKKRQRVASQYYPIVTLRLIKLVHHPSIHPVHHQWS